MSSSPFIGEIFMAGFSFAPRNHVKCDGQLLSIATNTALFSILGTIYGGDGRTTFGIPPMRGRAPMHWGNGPGLGNKIIGQKSGQENETVTTSTMPNHKHALRGNDAAGTTALPSNAVLSDSGPTSYEGTVAPNASMASASMTNSGGGQSHNNMQPYLTVNFYMATAGLFPSRN